MSTIASGYLSYAVPAVEDVVETPPDGRLLAVVGRLSPQPVTVM